MSEGFLGRWARRKQDAREGRPLDEPLPQADPPAAPVTRPTEVAPAHSPGAVSGQADSVATVPSEAPPPTLEDALKLTPQSDFAPFVARDVAPEVKNAAMKKLFADPHFNVMDGLDIYIDDYSIPDPLPATMLRKMASAQFLNLFDDDKNEKSAEATSPPPLTAGTVPTAAESAPTVQAPTPDASPIPQDDHADPDLRLQQDHAAGAQGSGNGPQ